MNVLKIITCFANITTNYESTKSFYQKPFIIKVNTFSATHCPINHKNI